MSKIEDQTILITGASGFVATHVLRVFLQRGYRVRGTVRSEQTAERVREIFTEYGDKLSFTIVKDIAQPGAFDEAVKGVQGVSSSKPLRHAPWQSPRHPARSMS